MKKNYMTPHIAFENMALNTTTSACTSYYTTDCKYWDASDDLYDGIPYYWDGLGEILIDGDALFESGCDTGFYCYDVPVRTIVLNHKS